MTGQLVTRSRTDPADSEFRPPANPGDTLRRVLVIKLGALGDFIQCLGAAKIVREVHRSAHITLLTTKPFAEFASVCPYFNAVESDGRGGDMRDQAAMIKRVRSIGYDMVYDFQNNDRTERYQKAFGARFWSGSAPGASHRHNNPNRAAMQNFDRLAEQLYHAGIGPNGIADPQPWPKGAGPMPSFDWIRPGLRYPPSIEPAYFSLSEQYAVIIPGSSPKEPEKRWPADRFAALCTKLADAGVQPVIVGGKTEGEIAQDIVRAESRVKNLVTRTNLFQLATLTEGAVFSIGGDTGPMHMAAATGKPGICLFAQSWDESNEARFGTIWNPETRLGRAAPKGGNIVVLHAASLEQVALDDVWRAIQSLRLF